jgi:DNA-binding NarL/FixJ family response regulator
VSNLQLLSIDSDAIFRLGLRVACEQYPDLEVVASVATGTEALRVLETRSLDSERAKKPADLVIFAVETLNLRSGQIEALAVCRELKSLYPNLPLLLLGGPLTPKLLAQVQAAGAYGYCPKGRDISQTMEAIRAVASGSSYWPADAPDSSEIELNSVAVQTIENSAANADKNAVAAIDDPPIHKKILAYFCLSGLQEIDAALAVVKADLHQMRAAEPTDLPSILDGVVLSGQRRELLAARWIVSQLLFEGREEKEEGRGKKEEGRAPFGFAQGKQGEEEDERKKTGKGRRDHLLNNSQLQVANFPVSGESLAVASDWRGSLFDSVAAKLQFNVVNLTGVPLEIDILRSTKKRELISSILRKLQDLLEELRFSQVQPTQLSEKMPAILRNLWEATIIDFFGRYYTLQTGETPVVDGKSSFKLPASQGGTAACLISGSGVEVVPVLLADEKAVTAEILDKIPMTVDLFAHFLFEIPLTVDNISCVAGSLQAMQRAEYLLENFVIQVASGVVQPLLNNFADIEEIKQSFYDGKLISTREIERFRNDLSWRYRWNSYFVEPKAIFESRFWLFVLGDSGIKRIYIYAPRNLELAQLYGWQLVFTLLLETRDAIAPRVRALISLFGAAVVYVLTQVIGRGIGLIGRGIIQGIGNSLQDGKFGKNG